LLESNKLLLLTFTEQSHAKHDFHKSSKHAEISTTYFGLKKIIKQTELIKTMLNKQHPAMMDSPEESCESLNKHPVFPLLNFSKRCVIQSTNHRQ